MSIAEIKQSIKEKVDSLSEQEAKAVNDFLAVIHKNSNPSQKSIQEIWEKAKANYSPLLQKLAQ